MNYLIAANRVARDTSEKEAIIFLGAVPASAKVYPQATRLLEALQKRSSNNAAPSTAAEPIKRIRTHMEGVRAERASLKEKLADAALRARLEEKLDALAAVLETALGSLERRRLKDPAPSPLDALLLD